MIQCRSYQYKLWCLHFALLLEILPYIRGKKKTFLRSTPDHEYSLFRVARHAWHTRKPQKYGHANSWGRETCAHLAPRIPYSHRGGWTCPKLHYVPIHNMLHFTRSLMLFESLNGWTKICSNWNFFLLFVVNAECWMLFCSTILQITILTDIRITQLVD